MGKKTPTQRSKEHLENLGWIVGVVEQTIPHTFIKRDLFGMFDLLAVKDEQTMGIQVTSISNITARVKKITEEPRLAVVRKAGWIVMVHGWKQKEDEHILREIDLS